MSQHHSVTGGWLGTYHYRGVQTGRAPVRFEATFTAATGGAFRGTILDDGAGGEARAEGVQAGRKVTFTKVYLAPRNAYASPVEYEGALSEDGKHLRGTWRIRQANGVWEARRLWSEATDRGSEGAGETQVRPEELAQV